MKRSRNGMVERCEEMRAAAMDRRNRGLHTGKMAKGHQFKRRDPERGSWAELVEIVQAKWCHAAADARAQFDWETRLQFVGAIDDCPF